MFVTQVSEDMIELTRPSIPHPQVLDPRDFTPFFKSPFNDISIN